MKAQVTALLGAGRASRSDGCGASDSVVRRGNGSSRSAVLERGFGRFLACGVWEPQISHNESLAMLDDIATRWRSNEPAELPLIVIVSSNKPPRLIVHSKEAIDDAE